MNGILEWHNECELSDYPLVGDFQFKDLIVDASFVQFDGFQPVLQKVFVGLDRVTFTILFDTGAEEVVCLQSTFESGDTRVRFYQATDRYLGVLVLGKGFHTLLREHVSRVFNPELPFLPHTVKSIPSKNGVYSLDSKYGELSFVASDQVMFYNSHESTNAFVFNAVSHHKLPEVNPNNPLKKLNLISPVNNQVFIAGNDVIKFQTLGSVASGLSAYLVNNPNTR